ncbi:MAG: hypothetical protein Q4D07_03745 [Selenomonadaceae bacterium]|nr:hypothetical protein [Selenomonadaceae bacterium]
MKIPFAKRIQDAMGERAPKEFTGGKWGGKAYPHIFLDMKYNFIDGKYPNKCDIKGNLFGENREIKYHIGAANSNSSQVMCINFFKKFFEKEEWEGILIKTLVRVGVPISSDKIKYAVFEYEPDSAEGTNFDFYMVMDDETCVSMEIKYTESEFGGISPDDNNPGKYGRKWNDIYSGMVENSPFLDCSEQEFYSEYQVNRNIVFARKNDVVLFLTPKANDAKRLICGRKYIDSFTDKYNQIRNVYWEDIVAELVNIIKDDELIEYYKMFKEKYIDVL